MCTCCTSLIDGSHSVFYSLQHVCEDCKKNFCSRCSAQLETRPRLCHTCQRFHGTMFERAELMKLKVKDLRDYLHLHEVPTQMCREKEELVELVLGQQTPTSDASTPSETHAHTPLSEQEMISEPSTVTEPPSTGSDVMTDLTSQSQTAGDEVRTSGGAQCFKVNI